MQQDIPIWFAAFYPGCSRQFNTYSKISIGRHKISKVNRPSSRFLLTIPAHDSFSNVLSSSFPGPRWWARDVKRPLQNSELNFHIWNANSQWFAWAKSEAKMVTHGGKFCTSVSVLLVVLYVSSSPLRDFNLQVLFIWLRKHSEPWKNCTDELLLDQFYIFECLKGFIIAVWPKNCPELSKDDKLTVKKGRALSTFLK